MSLRNPYEFTRTEYNDLVKNIPHPIHSQKSEYEEIELVEDCTLFDLYRQPRQPVTDPNATRSLYVRVLNEDLNCPVCLSVMRETKVVKECLHRFCAECIDKHLRMKSECPSCRMHIPSKRSLRRDTNFDELIARIYTNVDEFRDQEERLIAEINRERHCNNSVMKSTKLGVAKQQENRRNGGKKKTSDPEGSPSSSEASSPDSESSNKRQASWSAAASATSTANGSAAASTEENGRKKQRTASNGTTPAATNGHAPAAAATASSKRTPDEKEKVNVRILVHPEATSAPSLGRGLFRTSQRLTIGQLKKHLKNVLKVESVENMRIVLPALNHKQSGLREKEKEELKKEDGQALVRKDLKYDQELEDFVALKDIYRQYGMGTQWELQLYYHFSDTIVNGVAQFISNGV